MTNIKILKQKIHFLMMLLGYDTFKNSRIPLDLGVKSLCN